MTRSSIIFVLGAPGAGKGTYSTHLASDDAFNAANNLAVRHTSVGDLLRAQVAAGALSPALAEKVTKQILMDGKDLTDIIAASGVLEGNAEGDGKAVVVVDGFPRNADQLRAFGERFAGRPDLVISFTCDRFIAQQRFLGRHDASRPDGDQALFSKRCDEFERENPGILEIYGRDPGVGVIEVSAEGGVEESYELLKKALRKERRSPWFEGSG